VAQQGRPFPAFDATKDASQMDASALPDPDQHADFYSGVPTKRALAWVVDTVLTVLITVVIVPFTAFTALFFLPFLYLLVNFLYRWISLTRRSATPGMRLMAIEFRKSDGRPFDAATAAVHTLGFVISDGAASAAIGVFDGG
jgi:uncharacterized RDD family membrane protein YckC